MSEPISDLVIGLRTQDFHESLRGTTTFGPKEVEFRTTLLVGKAASLAMHLRGLPFVDNVQSLSYAASSLGIGGLELDAVLRVLEELNFVSVARGTGGGIKRVDVRVPEYRSGYADLGRRWRELSPGGLEQVGISTLQWLHGTPVPEDQLIQWSGLDARGYGVLKDVMAAGKLIEVHAIDGRRTVYTPLAVDGNPQLYLQWANSFPTEVRTVLDTLKSYQGLSVDDPRVGKSTALMDAVSTGVLMPVQINGATGPQRFVFAPKAGLDPAERIVLDKARAIVACVRYGQRYAAGRPVKYPRALLETLRDKKRFKRGHPDLESQYGLLTEKMIGEPVQDSFGNWNFHLWDTPENVQALNVSIEMLEYGESPASRLSIEAQEALLTPTGYLGPLTARPRLASDPNLSPATRAQIVREIARLARGGA